MVYILGGILMTNTAVALLFVPSTKDISKKYLRHAFRLIPSFCLGDAIFYLSWLPMMDGASRWDMLVTGFDLVYMLSEAVIYFALTILVDKLSSIPSFVGLFKQDPPMMPRADGQPEEAEDEDVAAERVRLQKSALPPGGTKYRTLTDAIESLGSEQAVATLAAEDPESHRSDHDLIRLEGLRKIYPGKNAVKDVYFGIPAGQCFGFLGVNGAGQQTHTHTYTVETVHVAVVASFSAFFLRSPLFLFLILRCRVSPCFLSGKTTTLKIMTGDVTPTQGQAFIGGYSIAHFPTEVRRLMGYCPQVRMHTDKSFSCLWRMAATRSHG